MPASVSHQRFPPTYPYECFGGYDSYPAPPSRVPSHARPPPPITVDRRPSTSGPAVVRGEWPGAGRDIHRAVLRRSVSPSRKASQERPELPRAGGSREREEVADPAGHSSTPPRLAWVDPRERSRSPEPPVTIDVSGTRYEVVKAAAERVGWCLVYSEAAQVQWIDTSVSAERVKRIARQSGSRRINHFPGIDVISRKAPLAKTLEGMRKRMPLAYDFAPRTFLEYREFLTYKQGLVQENLRRGGNVAKPYYIVKPSSGCMGKGIYLSATPQQEAFASGSVVQEYIPRPLLVEGRKFDLRTYVLITSMTPPRIYFYREGMMRLCAEPYRPPGSENEDKLCGHLTNYALNKGHQSFGSVATDGMSGGKRTLRWLEEWLEERGHDTGKFWGDVQDVCVKTVLAAAGTLSEQYKACVGEGDDGRLCFELLGVDILIDDDLKPWLVEVNHSPSLFAETDFDWTLKTGLLAETMSLLGVRPHGAKSRRRSPPAHGSPNWIQVCPNPDTRRQAVFTSIIQEAMGKGGKGVPRMSSATAARMQARQRGSSTQHKPVPVRTKGQTGTGTRPDTGRASSVRPSPQRRLPSLLEQNPPTFESSEDEHQLPTYRQLHTAQGQRRSAGLGRRPQTGALEGGRSADAGLGRRPQTGITGGRYRTHHRSYAPGIGTE